MDVVIYYEQLSGTHNESIIKDLSMAVVNVLETIEFLSPYVMRTHGDTENGLNWEDGHIPYNQLTAVLNEAVAGFEKLYAYGDSKCTLISQSLGRHVHNLERFKCPSPRYFRYKFSCTKPCHMNSLFRCATGNVHSLYKWLIHHLQKISYITCSNDKTRHTPRFVSAV